MILTTYLKKIRSLLSLIIGRVFKISIKLKRIGNLLKRNKNRKPIILVSAIIILIVLIPIIYLSLTRSKKTQAADFSLQSSSTSIQIDLPNRYRAVISTVDTEDYIVFYDRVQNNSAPVITHKFVGPHILENTVDYYLRYNNNRKTTVLESTTTRVKIRVEGCLDTAAGGTCLTDGTNAITVLEEYTFTNDGVFVFNQTNFQGTGITLDADSGHNGYEWLGVYTDITDAGFDDTGNITYGNGETEATTTTDGAEFASTNGYVFLPGAGSNTYQDAFIGVSSWLGANANGLTHEWNWDENLTSTGDFISAQAQAGSSATTSIQNASWFFLLKNERDLDTEAEREGLFNSEVNPDLPTYTLGSEWDDSTGVTSGMYLPTAGYVNPGNRSSLNMGTKDFTIELWVYLPVAGSMGLVRKGATSSTVAGYRLMYDSSVPRLMLTLGNGTSVINAYPATNLTFPTSGWHHVAVAADRDGSAYFYLDGTSIGSGTISSFNGVSLDNTASFIFSSNADAAFYADEVRVWDDLRTQTEIIDNMNKQIDPASTNLVGYWRLNENVGTVAYDETTNNNDGTLTGSPSWGAGYISDQYNRSEGVYTLNLVRGKSMFDLNAGPNVSTLLNGAVTAGATSITVDSSTGFPSSGSVYVQGNDKVDYTGTTSTTLTGISTTGESSSIGHADNSVVSMFNQSNPSFKFSAWLDLTEPKSATLEGVQLYKGIDYRASIKPVSIAYWAQDLTWYSTMENAAALTTTPDIGSAASANTATFVPAKYGSGLSAISGYATVPMASNLNGTAGTIEFWYKRTAASISSNAGFFESSQLSFTLARNSSDTSICFGMNGVFTSWTSTNVFDYNWHHIRLVYNAGGSPDTQELFIDGKSQGVTNVAMTAISTSYDLRVGKQYTEYAGGIIDEFKIYNSITTPLQIASGGDTGSSSEYLASNSNNQTLSFVDDDAQNRGEYIFIGTESPFSGLNVDLSTVGVGSSEDFQWQYWNGVSWSNLSVTDINTGASEWKSSGSFYWTAPGNWLPYSFNGATDLYYIRGHLEGGSYTTTPIEKTIKTDILTFQYLGNISSPSQTFSIPEYVPVSSANKGSSPIAVWNFDEGYGNTAYDSAVNDSSDQTSDHNLTILNALWTRNGDSLSSNTTYLSFDGSGDTAYVAYDPDFDFGSNSFTIEGWFRHPSAIASGGIVSKVSALHGVGYKVYMSGLGYICFGIDDTAGSFPEDYTCTTVSYADSRWHHFAAVKDSTNSISLFIDGELHGQDSSLGSSGSLNSSTSLYIGMDGDGTSNPWKGYIDQIVIYDYARTIDQVRTDYSGIQSDVNFN